MLHLLIEMLSSSEYNKHDKHKGKKIENKKNV